MYYYQLEKLEFTNVLNSVVWASKENMCHLEIPKQLTDLYLSNISKLAIAYDSQ